MDTPSRDFTRSLNERTTCRLSLSERAPGISSTSRITPTCMRSQCRGDFFDLVALDDVGGFHVRISVEHDAALHAVLDVRNVVLEAAKAADLAFPNLDGVTHQAGLAGALDGSLGDHAAGDRADLADAERLANFGLAERFFDQRRREETGHRFSDVVDGVVDDVVEADLDPLCLGEARCFARGPHSEADD